MILSSSFKGEKCNWFRTFIYGSEWLLKSAGLKLSSIGRPREFGKSEGIWIGGRYLPHYTGGSKVGIK